MKRRLVVGVDGSAAAERALAWACSAARALDAELLVAYVVDLSLIASPTRDQRLDDGRRVLADAVATAFESGVQQASSTLLSGDCAVRLIELSHEAFAIVAGHQGAGRIPSILLGSVAFRLAAHADCPVVLVGDHARLPDDPAVAAVVIERCDADSDPHAQTLATTLAQAFDQPVVVAPSHDELLAAARTAAVVVLGTDRNTVHRTNPTNPIASAVLHAARCAVAIVGPRPVPDQAK